MAKLTKLFGLAALILILGLWSVCPQAQESNEDQGEAPTGPQTDQIQSAARNLFKGLADADVALVAQNTASKYIRKLTIDKVRLPATGPKLKASFNGTVTIIRSEKKGAVVEAALFAPDSADVPIGEVSRVRIYMINEHGDWKASAATKEEADGDADINGGWYHAAFFTFCPNKGMIFMPNHFSRNLQCEEVEQCVRF